MHRREFFVLAAGAALATGATAAPHDHDDHGQNDWRGRNNRDWRDEHGAWHGDHDRYWRQDYASRGFVDRDRVFFNLRRRHYSRFNGDPFWFQGRYVVRTYDRWGNLIFVEVNPYTGEFIGIVRF